MENNPLVSICIPAYNAEKYIEETINCLLKQTYSNIEIIVVDDGSTDKTVARIRSFEDHRIKLLEQKNNGAGAARNMAFAYSRGEFIKFMDADDLISREAIMEQVQLGFCYKNAVISGRWGRFYHDDINTFTYAYESVWRNMCGDQWIIESWSKGPNMTQPGIFLIPRSIIEFVGPWKEELSQGPNDDMEFYTRTILNSKLVAFCDKSILYYRSGINGSLSKKKDRLGYEMAYETIHTSVQTLLSKNTTQIAMNASAIQFKVFIFDCYPLHHDLRKLAEQRVKELGGTNFKVPVGGYTGYLTVLFGWKLAKRIRISYLTVKQFVIHVFVRLFILNSV